MVDSALLGNGVVITLAGGMNLERSWSSTTRSLVWQTRARLASCEQAGNASAIKAKITSMSWFLSTSETDFLMNEK